MDTIFKLMFAILLFTYSWMYQEQNQEWDRERVLMKNAVNLAAHNAVLLVKEETVNEGSVKVNMVYQKFLDTLKENLGLDDDLQPIKGSPMLSEVRVVYFEVVDQVVYPYMYDHPVYPVAKYLRGPAVVGVIETDHPKLVRGPVQGALRVPAIHEYVEAQ